MVRIETPWDLINPNTSGNTHVSKLAIANTRNGIRRRNEWWKWGWKSGKAKKEESYKETTEGKDESDWRGIWDVEWIVGRHWRRWGVKKSSEGNRERCWWGWNCWMKWAEWRRNEYGGINKEELCLQIKNTSHNSNWTYSTSPSHQSSTTKITYTTSPTNTTHITPTHFKWNTKQISHTSSTPTTP